MKYFLALFLLVSILNLNGATRSLNTYLSASDANRLNQIFINGYSSEDIQTVYYSVSNFPSGAPDSKDKTCTRLPQIYKESKLDEAQKRFYYIASVKSLNCAKSVDSGIINELKKTFDKDFTNVQDMYYNYFARIAIDSAYFTETVKNKLAKNLQTLLKKDDSLTSLGLGSILASEFGAAGSFAFGYLEDALMQADEIDGKMLQFEGGLSVTASLIDGIFKLTKSLNKKSPLTEDQLVKFSLYFLSRRSVTTAKGANALLAVLKTICQQKSTPIVIRVKDNGLIQPDSPVLKILITDIMDGALKETPATVKITITNKSSKQKYINSELLQPDAFDGRLFKMDLKPKNIPKGTYIVGVETGDVKESNNIINILGRVRMDKVEVSVSEADSQTVMKKSVIESGKKMENYQLDHQQKFGLRYDLFDADTNKIISVHQAFVRFVSNANGAEIIFIAEQDITKAYKFEMDVGARASDFGSKSGVYSIDLIVGDALLVESFIRRIGEVTLKFHDEDKKNVMANSVLKRQALPEIHHQFREPEKRPPRFVSDLFTGLCLAPLLILFILWAKLGINVSNFTFTSLSGICFHGGLGLIFSLFFCFWLKLNMFQTIKYLIPLALFTFLTGNRVLRQIANKRLEKHEKSQNN